MNNIPKSILAAMQEHFHAVIRSRADHLIRKHQIKLPDLETFAASDERRGWFPIPGMYGGFSYWFEREGDNATLITLSASRIAGGSEQFHEITASGSRLIEGEEFRLRDSLWMETGSPVMTADQKTEFDDARRWRENLRATMAEKSGKLPELFKAQQNGHLRQYAGRNAIYRATGLLLPVTIERVSVTEQMLEVYVQPLKSPLIRWHNAPELFEPFEISCVWKEVSIDQDRWSAPQIGWKLIVKRGAYEAVLRLAKNEPELPIPALFELVDFVSNNPGLAEIPDAARKAAMGRIHLPLGYEAQP